MFISRLTFESFDPVPQQSPAPVADPGFLEMGFNYTGLLAYRGTNDTTAH